MLDLIIDAYYYAFVLVLLYADLLLRRWWCKAVGGLQQFVVWCAIPFLCSLQDQLENFVLPSEEDSSPISKMAASGDSVSCLSFASRSTWYCPSDYSVPPGFLSGNNVHFLQRTCYEEPVENKVEVARCRFPSVCEDVRKDTGMPPVDEASADSNGQVANEWEDDPMEVDEVDPRFEPMDVEPWNWNLDWTKAREQFNFESVLSSPASFANSREQFNFTFVLPPRASFASPSVVLEGATRVVDPKPVVTKVTASLVGEGARTVPVVAPAIDTRRVLLEEPQEAAPAATDDDLGAEIDNILAEILDDSD